MFIEPAISPLKIHLALERVFDTCAKDASDIQKDGRTGLQAIMMPAPQLQPLHEVNALQLLLVGGSYFTSVGGTATFEIPMTSHTRVKDDGRNFFYLFEVFKL